VWERSAEQRRTDREPSLEQLAEESERATAESAAHDQL
jgi:hypothetical protein